MTRQPGEPVREVTGKHSVVSPVIPRAYNRQAPVSAQVRVSEGKPARRRRAPG
jgi:hypothetical protein